MRNRLAARVVAVQPGSQLWRVELDAGVPVFALVTRPACEESKIRPGANLVALVKAPAVYLIVRQGSPPTIIPSDQNHPAPEFSVSEIP